MKLFHISLLLLSALLLNGCMGEDTDDCPPLIANNLSIEFLYPGDDGKNIFNQKITKADLFVFDEGGRYVTNQSIDQPSLSVFPGAHLKLNPGTYRIVCWGNAAYRSEFSGINSGSLFTGAFIGNSTIDVNSVAINGDQLYYAPDTRAARSPHLLQSPLSLPQGFTVTVPAQGAKTVSINFTRAHIRVVAYIKGFEDRSPQGASLTPLVELTDISPKYDFNLQKSGNPVTYRNVSTLTTVEGEQMAVMDFNTPLFDENTPMQLVIKKQSDGSTLTTVSLKGFIRDNNITIGNSVDLVLPIMIEYIQGSFEITLPGWGQNPVEPEL